MARTIFNDPKIKLNILSGEKNVYRPVYQIADGVDLDEVKRGRWVVLNSDRRFEFVTGDTGALNCKLLLQDGTHGDVTAFNINSDGSARAGFIAVADPAIGFIAEVGHVGYDYTLGSAAYAPQTPLKVTSGGILTVADPDTDVVTAYSEGINERDMLVFTTRGGK